MLFFLLTLLNPASAGSDLNPPTEKEVVKLNTADRHFAPSSNSAVRQDTPFRHRLATGDFSHPPALICGVYPARGGFRPFQGGVLPRFTPSQISKTPHLTASDRVKPHNKFFFVQLNPVNPVQNSFPVRVFRVFRGLLPLSTINSNSCQLPSWHSLIH